MISFKNTYNSLPESFYENVPHTNFPDLKLITSNKELLKQLGINSVEKLISEIKGEVTHSQASNIAMAYAGHQFGHFVPQLGDGRAMLLGEVLLDQKQYDIHLKGSGQTKFSRRGDGRSSLGPVIREYLLSEAMFALGIPTTRALAAFTTGEIVYREEELPGGLFVRGSYGHLRVGTFEYFAMQGKYDEVQVLADYCINRLCPEYTDASEKYFKFFKWICGNKLNLVAKWLGVGFIHGVMNTDNTSISGETIDYGPCAFMDKFSAGKVFSSIDRYGRYAYSNQMDIAIWNMSVLAHCLLPLIAKDLDSVDKAEGILTSHLEFLKEYASELKLKTYLAKFGLETVSDNSKNLLSECLEYMEANHLDFTNTFSKMIDFEFPEKNIQDKWLSLIEDKPKALSLMRKNNPLIIPRNHQIEHAIQLSLEGDYSYFHFLLEAYKNPYEITKDTEKLTLEPKPDELVHQTFCGT